MVARYGDFVLYRPPLKLTTLLLWFGPLLLLASGFAVLLRRVLRRRPAQDLEITASERKRAAELLAGNESERRGFRSSYSALCSPPARCCSSCRRCCAAACERVRRTMPSTLRKTAISCASSRPTCAPERWPRTSMKKRVARSKRGCSPTWTRAALPRDLHDTRAPPRSLWLWPCRFARSPSM